ITLSLHDALPILGAVRPQERVGRQLQIDSGRRCWLPGGNHLLDILRALLELLVLRLDRQSELGIGQRVLVPEVDLCRRWQGHDLFKRLPHRLVWRLVDPSAADGEQNIADESYVRGRDPVDDVTSGVARTVENVDLE